MLPTNEEGASPVAINMSGQAVGVGYFGVKWSGNRPSVLPDLGVPLLVQPTDINDQGQIVATGIRKDQISGYRYALLLTPE